MVERQRTKGLGALEIVAPQGHVMGRHLRGMFGQPALGCGPVTVLLSLSVLWHDGRRGQGQDLRMPRADDHGCDGGMGREGGAIGALPGEAVVARHGGGRQGVGASQRHQPLIPKAPERRQQAVRFEALTDLHTHRIECKGGSGSHNVRS